MHLALSSERFSNLFEDDVIFVGFDCFIANTTGKNLQLKESLVWPTKSATDSHEPRFKTEPVGFDDFIDEDIHNDAPSGAQFKRLKIAFSVDFFNGPSIRLTSFHVSMSHMITTLSSPQDAR